MAGLYNPLVVDPNFHPKVRDLTVHDAARNRDIPVRIYFPPNEKPAPVVLFSHGLGGSRADSKFLGERWAARGHLAVFGQQPRETLLDRVQECRCDALDECGEKILRQR